MLSGKLICSNFRGISQLLLLCLSFVACGSFANVTEKVTLAEQQLELWVDKKLTRVVLKRLKRSAYYADKPLLLVVMKDGKIQPKVDKLHAFVKQRLSEQLLRYGVSVIDRTRQIIPVHHRTPNSLNCDPHNGVQAYLAIELQPQRGSRVKAKFRLIDAYDQQQAPQFFEHASKIKLWRYEADDWQTLSFDEGLRGLRHLPFTMEQPDLMAKYLADNLSCLLRLKLNASLKLAVDGGVLEPPMDTVVANLSAYLAQNDEVTIHSTQEQANYVIRVESDLIDQWSRLFQVRATVEDLRTQEILGGVPTSSYMSFNEVVDTEQVVYKTASETKTRANVAGVNADNTQSVNRPQTIPLSRTPLLGVADVNNPLSAECVRYVGGSNCNGPFTRENKPWVVRFKTDTRYQGAMVIASLLDHNGDNFRQITGRCSVTGKGHCDIRFNSEAGLYKGGFVIEANIYQGDAAHPIKNDSYFKQIYYTK